MKHRESFDLAVVGAGIVGLSSAFWARRLHPDWSIALLDQSMVGSGATGYSAAVCTPLVRSAAFGVLASRSAEVLDAMSGPVAAARPRQLPIFFLTEKACAQRLAECLDLSADALLKSALASERAPAVFPAVGQHQVAVGPFEGASRAARRVAEELAHHLMIEAGVACWEGARVDDVITLGKRLTLRLCDGRWLDARRVVVATGPWLRMGPGREAADQAGVRVKKIVALHIDRRPSEDAAMWYLFDHGAFLAPLFHEGRWLFSFTCTEWDCAPERSRLPLTESDRSAGLALLERYFPQLVSACSGGRVFCDAYTPDWAPIVRAVSGQSNFVIAGAAAGAGFRLGPGLGAIAVEALDRSEGTSS